MTDEQAMAGNGPRELTLDEVDAVGGGVTPQQERNGLLTAAGVVGIVILCLL
jgi:hypothetical protein